MILVLDTFFNVVGDYMKTFKLVADITFEAEGIDDAFSKLEKYFRDSINGKESGLNQTGFLSVEPIITSDNIGQLIDVFCYVDQKVRKYKVVGESFIDKTGEYTEEGTLLIPVKVCERNFFVGWFNGRWEFLDGFASSCSGCGLCEKSQ